MSAHVDAATYEEQPLRSRWHSNRLAETIIYGVLLLLGVISLLPIWHHGQRLAEQP